MYPLLTLLVVLLPVSVFTTTWMTARNADRARSAAAETFRLQTDSNERVLLLLTEAMASTTAANAAAATAISGTIAEGLRPVPTPQPAVIQLAEADSGTWWGQDQQAMSGPIDPLDAYSDAPPAAPVNRVGSMPAGYDPIAAMLSNGGWERVPGGMAPPDLAGEYLGDEA